MRFKGLAIFFLTVPALCALLCVAGAAREDADPDTVEIKWLDFNIPAAALDKAYDCDVKSHDGPEVGIAVDWIELLAILGTKYGGNWTLYKPAHLDETAMALHSGKTPAELLKGYKNYNYYRTAYGAVLGGFVGPHQREVPDKESPGGVSVRERYGLKAYMPIAEGYGYSHYRDFGDSRGYGYRRSHFGNDLLGAVGTPVIAVEGGTVEELGWNRFGGWRVGIRSFDRLRYYYYAHLRKDHPYPAGLETGSMVQGGDVIGYLGMTGYSNTENVNGMKIPHLHFGLQLVFDESEKDGPNQLWIDVYDIVEFLKRNRASVRRLPDSKDYQRAYRLFDYHFPFCGE